MKNNQFNKFYDFIISEAFSQWEYEMPKDKEQRLYDFYMLTGLNEPNDEKLKVAYNDAREELTNALTEHLKDALYMAITCEFRHVFTQIDDGVDGIKKISQKNNMLKFMQVYYSNYKKYTGGMKSLYIDKKDEEEMVKRRKYQKLAKSRDYQLNFKAIESARKTSRSSIEEFVQFTKEIFKQLKWNSSYGGDNWAMISDGWLMLNDAETISDKIVAIDHAYDLQHNTDTVFNKLQTYYKSGGSRSGYEWIKSALDFKKDIKNLYEINNSISPGLKSFAMAVIKDTTGNSYEFWLEKQRKMRDNLKKAIQPVPPKLKFPKNKKIKHNPAIYENDKIFILGLPEGGSGQSKSEIETLYAYYTRIKNNTIKMDVDISGMRLKWIPKWFEGLTIEGDFECMANYLIDLQYSPFIVTGVFDASRNKLGPDGLYGIPYNVSHIVRLDFHPDAGDDLTSDEMDKKIKSYQEETRGWALDDDHKTWFTLAKETHRYNQDSSQKSSDVYDGKLPGDEKLTMHEFSGGIKEWRLDGKLHRDGAPAVMKPLSRTQIWFQAWYQHGEFHREDGPALEYPTNPDFKHAEQYWLNGKQYTEYDYWAQIKKLKNEDQRDLPKLKTYPDGTKEWYDKDGEFHNDNGPAVISFSGVKEWFKHGVLHRVDGPAIKYRTGGEEWYLNGVLHREDGPAVKHADSELEYWLDGRKYSENDYWAKVNRNQPRQGLKTYPDGTKRWYLNGKLHNEDGPAVIYPDGIKLWFINDLKHRENGPAVEYPDGYKEYWLDGREYLETDYWAKQRKI